MTKNTIEINEIPVEIIEYKKEDGLEKLGMRRLIYGILTHIDKDDISIYWINRISKDFENNDDEFKVTINGILDHIGRDKLILCSQGATSMNSGRSIKPLTYHVAYERSILESCGFYEIYFKTDIPGYVNPSSIYGNPAADELLDMLIEADVVENILMQNSIDPSTMN